VRDLTKTKVPTIFLSLTFTIGIYGIYFSYIPESNWRYGFYAILALSNPSCPLQALNGEG
jgi:magnesium transporter